MHGSCNFDETNFNIIILLWIIPLLCPALSELETLILFVEKWLTKQQKIFFIVDVSENNRTPQLGENNCIVCGY